MASWPLKTVLLFSALILVRAIFAFGRAGIDDESTPTIGLAASEKTYRDFLATARRQVEQKEKEEDEEEEEQKKEEKEEEEEEEVKVENGSRSKDPKERKILEL
ncbi:hypothetical protein HZH66_012784 [Vespula vulgaris]|uniref:Uncharacterized protein n=1 Tax=Vespula vulgaris TaxID=7454 RepID=A0A834MTT6_VESVU|nr:hypothetical protein HZH66_012784 [Vespula vulgaris]